MTKSSKKYAKVNNSTEDWIHGNAFKVRVLVGGKRMFTMITFAGDPDAIYSRLLKQKEKQASGGERLFAFGSRDVIKEERVTLNTSP